MYQGRSSKYKVSKTTMSLSGARTSAIARTVPSWNHIQIYLDLHLIIQSPKRGSLFIKIQKSFPEKLTKMCKKAPLSMLKKVKIKR